MAPSADGGRLGAEAQRPRPSICGTPPIQSSTESAMASRANSPAISNTWSIPRRANILAISW